MAVSHEEISKKISDDVPAVALSQKTRNKLSRNLNPPMPRGNDWKGLADELEFTYLDIRNIDLNKDPTGELLDIWGGQKDATICALVKALEEIERYDVLKDADKWNRDRIQVAEVSSPLLNSSNTSSTADSYDAFVCYTEKDAPFVIEMMKMLETESPNSIKLCVEFRDILPGASWASASVDLIGRRCRRMIVVLSPDFKGTPQCDFQTKFALSLAPGTEKRRIIPIMYKQCEVPEILAHLTICNYTKKDLRPWFWSRLAQTLALS
ncbi:myeloid differentiation primary response protein MyD88-like [Anneissia japonica]|uniref:myeloid differentiation primary response protein MyD88-like n=1 Tax=Anneissia japonica TaxID=1529436 RepID=UPI0014256138|nr:myeloid differentiation primary response protein MyD88-like [Anneissia japonica]